MATLRVASLWNLLSVSVASTAAVRTSWGGRSGLTRPPAAVSTNAPVLRWVSSVDPNDDCCGPTSILKLRVNVSSAHEGRPIWSTGVIVTNVLPTWQGLAVYEGPALQADHHYSWVAEEGMVAYSNGTAPASSAMRIAATGTFTTTADLASARAEAAAVMSAPNVSALWNGSWHSVNDRIQPSGFLPTSVSGGYGGITQMFVRDASGQLIGLLQCGEEQTRTAGKALRFMLSQLRDHYKPGSFLSYAPHVMQANKQLTQIVSFDTIDQTDDTFYLIAAYGLYIQRTDDTQLRDDFYELLKNYTLHYFAPGARSFGGGGGTPTKPSKGGGVLYWNESLSLVWNANLEHSRLGSYWSCYDQLTNSFAAEGLRVLHDAASAMGLSSDATLWKSLRTKVLYGINTSLTYADQVDTGGHAIYAELRGHENRKCGFVLPVPGFSEDKDSVGWSPLLWGMSYENIVPVVLGLSSIGQQPNTTMPAPDVSSLGLDEVRLDNTWSVYRREASFQWITTDPENSAFVSMTHVNSSGLIDPPGSYGAPPPPSTPCDASKWKIGAAALTLGTGPDLSITNASTAAECCAACKSYIRSNKGRAPGCGVWFYNGDASKCFLKSHASPDKITKPSPNFAAGYGEYHTNGWCEFTGSFKSPPMQGCPAPGGKTCACASTAVIGKGIGWELGWAAHKRAYTRLISLHRWLGQASHVEVTTLFGESYLYDCILQGEAHGFAPMNEKNPRGSGCWGDPGNGVQIGWFLWGEALARISVGLKPV